MDSLIAQLSQQLVNGLTLGAVYALIALGYSMVYGALRMLNFAHGDVYMVGAFMGYFIMTALVPETGAVLPPLLIVGACVLAAMAGCGLLGVAIEQVAYRPLRNAPRIAPLMSALGVSFLLQNVVQLTLTADHRVYPIRDILPPSVGFDLGVVQVSATRALVMVMALALMVGLHYLVQKTALGRSVRAVASDREAAAMMGINVDRTIWLTFFIGSALAGAAGVFTGVVFTRVWHVMGFTAGLKGFTAAVLGGIGSIPGAMLGGFLLGLIEVFAVAFLSPTFRDAIAFVVLLLVLLMRPRGLLGARVTQKV